MDEHIISRRAAVAVLTAAPALALASTVATAAVALPDRSAWQSALAEYLTADKAVDDYDRDFLSPVSARYMDAVAAHEKLTLVGSPKHADVVAAEAALDPVQDRFDELVGIEYDAFLTLIETPAPDLGAVAEKIRLGFEGEMWFGGMQTEQIAHLHADVRRLLQKEA
jgi:hypothetical protein